jgi:hypothetical protein
VHVAEPPEVIEFDPDERGTVVARMEELEALGSGWVNIEPAFTDEELAAMPADNALGRLVSARGPVIPLGTWVAPVRTRRGAEPSSVGIQHGAGARAVAQLREYGLALPEGSRLKTDHPRRGLVVELPVGADPDDVLDWMLRAAIVLSPIALPDRWRAHVYRG